MTPSEREPSDTAPAPARSRWLAALGLLAAVVLVGCLYRWTVWPESDPVLAGRDNPDYYSLLTRGFMKGHFYLDLPADPYLATLSNPWDPSQRAGHGLHDASYFQGHYYIYFGVTPVLVLNLPFRLLTGLDVDQAAASVLYALVGVAASVWLLGRIRERFFPRAHFLLTWALALGLGINDMMPLLLRRPNLWEVPITCAYACFVLALAFLYAALTSPRRNLLLGIASACFGLAVGARPTYLFGCLALAVPLLLWARDCGGFSRAWREASWRRSLLAGLIPLSLVGLFLAFYNYERFGSIAEFGQRYQMSGDDGKTVQFFNWRFPLYGLRVYGLLPARWSPYFPFVSAADIPERPHGQLGVEAPYGILPNIPFVVMAVGLAFLGKGRRLLRAFCLALAVGTLLTGLTVMSFGGITNRYMVDFVPGMILLASLGALATCYRPDGRPRRALIALSCLLLGYSALFNVLASIRHNELFRAEHPKAYAKVVHAGNQLSFAFDRWFNKEGYGDLELRLMIPEGKPGTLEPLVITGTSFLSDYLVIHYEGNHQVRFGHVHTNYPIQLTKPVTVSSDEPHTLVVGMGSLYPPAAHPYFDPIDPLLARHIQDSFRLVLDGTVIIETNARYYDAASFQPRIGTSGPSQTYEAPFSGKVLSVRRVPPVRYNSGKGASHVGPVEFKIKIPAFTHRHSEPLICTGATGRGDLVYITYLARDKVLIGFDHWGVGGTDSGELTIDPSHIQTIRIDFASLHPAPDDAPEPKGGTPGRLVVVMNGRKVIDTPQAAYRCQPDQVSEGDNMIETSTAEGAFTGEMLSVRYLGSASAPGR